MATAEIATATDYLYSMTEGEEGQYLTRYPVLRMTARGLWVHADVYDYMAGPSYYNKYQIPTAWKPCRPDSFPARDFSKVKREAIERTGESYHRPTRILFNREIPEYWHRIIAGFTETKSPLPECFRAFGFTSMPTHAEFEAAYKSLAVKLHPDMGGDKDAFAAAAYQAEECRKRFAR